MDEARPLLSKQVTHFHSSCHTKSVTFRMSPVPSLEDSLQNLSIGGRGRGRHRGGGGRGYRGRGRSYSERQP